MKRTFSLLIACLPWVCAAQPSGNYQYQFANGPALWDFTGSYTFSEDAFRVENTLAHRASGVLIGGGTARYSDFLVQVNGSHAARGRVLGANPPHVAAKVIGSGQFSGVAFGVPISGPFKASIALTLDPTNRVLFGTESASACIRTRGCRTLTTNVTFQLPDGMDGTWALALNVATSNNVVRGTAVVQLSNNRSLSFNVRGSYLPATGTSRLKLLGTGDAKGRRLSLSLNAAGALETLNGNLLGQRLVFP